MSEFQNILALETALAGCSAAALAGEPSAMRREPMVRGQAEHLVPFAQEAMEEAGLGFADLDAVLCTIGPGAFTGLRIAMSAARAFALSVDVPVIGITTLQALALDYSAQQGKACSVILETKRSDFYFQSFDAQGQAVSEARAALGDVVADTLPGESVLIGDGAARFASEIGIKGREIDDGYGLIDLVMVGKALQTRGVDGEVFTRNPQPIYLRDADVSMPKNPPRVLQDAG